MAANALRSAKSVPERAGTVYLRAAEPRGHLPVLVLGRGFLFGLPVCGLGRRTY
jgi:hypothetical protein